MADSEPTFRDFQWLQEVLKSDPEHYLEDDAYEMSNGKKFKSTDKTNSGIYDGT